MANDIKLVIAGDDSSLTKALKNSEANLDTFDRKTQGVNRSTKELAEGLEGSTRGLRGQADVIDGVTTSIGALGIAIPGPVGGVLSMTRGLADLSDGAGVLVTKFPLLGAAVDVAFGPIGIAVGVAAALAAGFVVLWKNSETFRKITTEALKDVGDVFLDYIEVQLKGIKWLLDAASHLPKWLGGGIASDASGAIGSLINGIEDLKGELASLADQYNGVATAAKNAGLAQQLASQFGGTAADPDGMFTSNSVMTSMEQSGTKSLANMTNADFEAATKTAKTKAASGAGSVVDAAKQAAEQKLSQWQSLIDKAKSTADSLVAALSPKVEASTPGGQNIWQKLLQQAQDTIKLNKDLESLSKKGLNSGLLSSLAQGGLASLPAVEELNNASKADIKWANNVSAMTTGAAQSIGADQAMRDFTASQKATTVNVKVDLSGGEDALKKLFRKWMRVDGAQSFGLVAAK